MRDMFLPKCNSYDETGRLIEKNVIIYRYDDGRQIISFGGWCEYFLDDLLKDYPFIKNIYIDAMGRNHYGSPVFIKFEDLNKTFKIIKEIIIKEKEMEMMLNGS